MQKKSSTKKSTKPISISVESISPKSTKFVSPESAKSSTREYVPLYRRIALTFLGLSLILSLGILYLSTARAKIFITPKPEIIKTNFKVTLQSNVIPTCQLAEKDPVANDDCLPGQILTTTVEGKETFPATQVEFKEKRAQGMVTIINNYSKSQTLVRTTRLLSPEGILFRTDQTIKVPAGSQMQVRVYADQPGVEGEIGPSHFTIPGLWPGIQDKIYGESKEAMTGGIEEIKIVTQTDIQQAKDILEDKLAQKALEELRIMNYELGIRNKKESQVTSSKLQKDIFQLTSQEIIEITIDSKPGDKKNEFQVEMKLKLIGIKFDEKEMFALAEKKLEELLSQHMKLLALEKKDITYILDSYNMEEKTAVLKVLSQGKAVIALDNPLLAKDPLINKNEKQVKAYLEKFPEIESVQVKFSPFWVRKVPFLRDHIEIIIYTN